MLNIVANVRMSVSASVTSKVGGCWYASRTPPMEAHHAPLVLSLVRVYEYILRCLDYCFVVVVVMAVTRRCGLVGEPEGFTRTAWSHLHRLFRHTYSHFFHSSLSIIILCRPLACSFPHLRPYSPVLEHTTNNAPSRFKHGCQGSLAAFDLAFEWVLSVTSSA